MNLDYIAKNIELPFTNLEDCLLYERDIGLFELSAESIRYKSVQLLKSRLRFYRLSKNYPSNRFMAGFYHTFSEEALGELQQKQQEGIQFSIGQDYSRDELPFVKEILEKFND